MRPPSDVYSAVGVMTGCGVGFGVSDRASLSAEATRTHLPYESKALQDVQDLLQGTLARLEADLVRCADEATRFVEALHERRPLDRLRGRE